MSGCHVWYESDIIFKQEVKDSKLKIDDSMIYFFDLTAFSIALWYGYLWGNKRKGCRTFWIAQIKNNDTLHRTRTVRYSQWNWAIRRKRRWLLDTIPFELALSVHSHEKLFRLRIQFVLIVTYLYTGRTNNSVAYISSNLVGSLLFSLWKYRLLRRSPWACTAVQTTEIRAARPLLFWSDYPCYWPG